MIDPREARKLAVECVVDCVTASMAEGNTDSRAAGKVWVDHDIRIRWHDDRGFSVVIDGREVEFSVTRILPESVSRPSYPENKPGGVPWADTARGQGWGGTGLDHGAHGFPGGPTQGG
jgi:hypothetical protein